jgi:hypothetical protein
MESTIFQDITPCSPLSVIRRFGGTYRLRRQGWKIKLSKKPALKQLESFPAYFFVPEDGGDMFLRNVGWHSTDYTALYPRRLYSALQLVITIFKFLPLSIFDYHILMPTAAKLYVSCLILALPHSDLC